VIANGTVSAIEVEPETIEEVEEQVMVKKYVKKPVVIEAVRFLNSADVHEFCGDKVKEPIDKDYLEIETLEGVHKATKGDYIIKGIKGEFYPCKPDIFEATYEEVKE
jgi:hypothetical protein